MSDKTKLYTMIGEYPNTKALRSGAIKSDLVEYDFDDVKVPNTAFKPLVRDAKYDCSELAINTFLQVADYYLVARALAHADVVVTHEVVSASINKVKIPDVCIGMGIKCMTPFEMLRVERARFILG